MTAKTEKATSETTIYSYDAEDRLIRIDFADARFAAYRYDGLGRRISKTFTRNASLFTLHYIYDGEDMLYEFTCPPAGCGGTEPTLQARYTHGPGIDEPLILERDLDASGTFEPNETFFYHTDALGSITELTDINGQAAQFYVYDAFGNMTVFDAAGAEITPESAIANPYTYTGREFDIESGLYYYRARYYDPRIGRFTQADPIGFQGGDTNFYAYVANNPVNFTDAFGLVASSPGLAGSISGAVGLGGLIAEGIQSFCGTNGGQRTSSRNFSLLGGVETAPQTSITLRQFVTPTRQFFSFEEESRFFTALDARSPLQNSINPFDILSFTRSLLQGGIQQAFKDTFIDGLVDTLLNEIE